MCVTFVTCEVRVCGLRCRSGSSLYIYRVCLLTYLLTRDAGTRREVICVCTDGLQGRGLRCMSASKVHTVYVNDDPKVCNIHKACKFVADHVLQPTLL